MAEEEKDKSEPATPFKLKEAKKRGQVAKSLEVNTLFVISGFVFVMYLWGENLISQDLLINTNIFKQAHMPDFSVTEVNGWVAGIMNNVFLIFLPLLAVLIGISIISNVVQTGFILTFFPLKPDLNRINPINGLKRLFSKKLLFEAVKSIIKLGFFGAILYFAISGALPELFGLMQSDPDNYPVKLLELILELILKILAGLLIIALLDLLYTRWEYSNKMKMSRREVKEEIKRREGDPHLRAKIKELQKEAAKNRESLSRLPEADVLITNPTHLAVALAYNNKEMTAPKLVTKASGKLALQMKALAKKLHIPVIEDKALARLIYRELKVDEHIRESHYQHVAAVFAEMYAIGG